VIKMMSKKQFKKRINEYIVDDLYEWYLKLGEENDDAILFMEKNKNKNRAILTVVPERY